MNRGRIRNMRGESRLEREVDRRIQGDHDDLAPESNVRHFLDRSPDQMMTTSQHNPQWNRRSRRLRSGAISVGGVVLFVSAIIVIAFLQWLPRVGLPVDPSGRPLVEVWGWNIAAESLKRLAPEFDRKFPGEAKIDIKVSGASVQSRLLLSLAAGTGAPDICPLQEREAAKFTGTGRLLDLTPFAAKHEKDFSPSFWVSCLDKGRVYAMPWDMGPCAVYYKRWVLEKYRIDPNAIETWDDFLAAGKTLKEKSRGTVSLFPLSTSGLSDMYMMLAQQNGGGLFDRDGRLIIDQPRNVEALGLLRRMIDAGVTAPTQWGPELFASFNSDDIATYPGAVWMMKMVKDSSPSTAGKWGVFRLPAMRPGGLRASNHGGSVLIIPAQSKHAERAWQFLEYTLCDTESQITQFREFGLFPAYLPAHKHPYFEQGDPYFADQNVSKVFAQDIDKVPPLIRTRDWNEASRYLGQTMSDWHSRRLEDGPYLKSVAAALSRKLQRPIASDAMPAADAAEAR